MNLPNLNREELLLIVTVGSIYILVIGLILMYAYFATLFRVNRQTIQFIGRADMPPPYCTLRNQDIYAITGFTQQTPSTTPPPYPTPPHYSQIVHIAIKPKTLFC